MGKKPRKPGRWGASKDPLVRMAFFEKLAEAGWNATAAAGWVDVHPTLGMKWMRDPWPASILAVLTDQVAPGVGKLSFVERARIEQLRRANLSMRQIAALLGRAPSTISREIARGADRFGRYRARAAQDVIDASMARPKRRKLEDCQRLRRVVVEWLRRGYSPEQITGRLVRDYPNDPEMRVSHETIYQALYVNPRGGLATEVRSALRHGHALRTTRHSRRAQGRHHRSSKIKDMILIADRPAEVEDRAVPGHWEGDLIKGSTASNSSIGTLVERTTGFVMLLHLPDGHRAHHVEAAMQKAIAAMPQMMRRSLTWDQGRELARHASITATTGMPIYFCDPHAPWQRGSNENTNGLLREYFPKGTDLSIYSADHLDQVAAELNNRPRKRLDFANPAEVWNELLSKHQTGVAPTP